MLRECKQSNFNLKEVSISVPSIKKRELSIINRLPVPKRKEPRGIPKKPIQEVEHKGGGNTFSGPASWYGSGQRTANGESFDPSTFTAAHRSLRFGTKVRVQHGNSSVVVRINDRGPYAGGRVIDLSRAAFEQLAPLGAGVISVTCEVIE